MSKLPVYESKPPDLEDKLLVEQFDKIETGQIDLLDESGKRIIELVTVLLGVLLAVLALDKNFPPPYVKDNALVQILAVCALVYYILAMLNGMRVVQPRKYKRYTQNLTALRQELDKIVDDKARALRWAGSFFLAGSVCLASLIVTIILWRP